MKVNLTDTFIRAIKPSTDRYTFYTDAKNAGLSIRVNSRGTLVWIIQKKVKGGRRNYFTLGSYPAVTLKAAREQAYAVQAEAEAGIDRIEVAKKAKAAELAEQLAARSVKDILEIYFATYVEQNLKPRKSRKDRVAQLRTHLGALADEPITKVTRADLQEIIDAKAAEGKPVMANRVRAAFTAFFGWAESREYIKSNPAERIQKAIKEKARTRTPSIAEVREIWEATFEQGALWGAYFRLCILTGQRSRSDIMSMQWDWIDWEMSRYSIPNPKNGQPHIVHLCPAAIKELKAFGTDGAVPSSGLVFSTTGTTPMSGLTKPKTRLDETINQRRAKAGSPPMPEWHLHDLRRAQATALAEAGVDEGVVDRIQNHIAGGSRASGVAAVYNRAQKLSDRAKALDLWADMVTGTNGKIIPIRDVA